MTGEEPLFRVVRGTPREPELAALASVLYGLARRENAESGAGRPSQAPWGRPQTPAGAWAGARAPSWRPMLP